MNSIEISAPAKINLYLRILAKRPDSYHDIETIFARLDLSDEITLKKRKDSSINVFCDSPELKSMASGDNLCYKAAKALFDAACLKATPGVDIILKKNIPVSSGLGGGSSDAASVILGLNRLFDLDLEKDELLRIGRGIGADVPFFIFNQDYALGRGIGDILEKIDCKEEFWNILLFIPAKKSTKDIYSRVNLNLTKVCPDVKITRYVLENFDLNKLASSLYNELEDIAIKEDIRIKSLKELLLKQTLGASLSGSGPTVFGVVKNKEVGLDLTEKLKTQFREFEGLKVILVKTTIAT